MAIIIGVVLAIAISLSSARIQTINGDLNEEKCTCKDLINVHGYGNCQGTLDPKHDNKAICYVNQPSSCGDLTYSIANPGEKVSAEACWQNCNDDPNWIDNKYGDGSSKCTDMTSNYCENYGGYSTEAQKNCPVACGMCSGTSSSATIAATTTPPGRIVALTTSAESCTCKDLISKWGYGNCQGTLDSSRGNVAVCYVNQPSSCGDLVDSSTNPGEKSSAEPCSQALSKQGAEKACNEFGNGWSVNVVRDGSVVCTLNSLNWGKNCNKCDTWRLVVWKDGAHERKPGYGGYNGIQISTKAGRYYGGHDPCEIGDNLPVCGEWSTHPGSGYENPEVSSGLKELSTQLLTSTRAPTLQTTENIQSTQGNTPGHQSSHCRDQKIWCNLADCSLANVKRNCQKTCNLC